MKVYYNEFCTGCGLCQNIGIAKMSYKEDGFPYPDITDSSMKKICDELCPMSRKSLNQSISTNLWGNYLGYYKGYSTNKEIRYKAASGGILTTVCRNLLETGKVNGIIQTSYNPKCPTETITLVSYTLADIERCAGSRYSVSMPLTDIDKLISDGKKYVFVGKPCDVTALKNYSKMHERISKSIIFYLSFFCAGTPSRNANNDLLKSLGCKKECCKSLVYRGNGWPGYVTATDNEGEIFTLDYQTAWMNILGRVIRKSCKFCIDSIGENSDLSCGDYWLLDDDGNPSFKGNDGISCIFTWSKKGENILNELSSNGLINIEDGNIELLQKVQPNHYYRRTTILYRWLGMKILFKQAPKFSARKMIHLSKYISLKKGLGSLKGTIVRIFKGAL